MKKINNHFVGWLKTSISSVVEGIPELVNRFPYILISSIDSSFALKTLTTTNLIVRDFDTCRFMENSLLIEGVDIGRLAESYNLFNGFDEIWFFSSLPLKNILPDGTITGPLKITDNIPDGLVQWMKRSGCILGLGDGTGLNYITNDKSIAKIIEVYYDT